MAALEQVVQLKGVWKIFGDRATEAMEALQRGETTNLGVMADFNCFIGIADCSFEVYRGEIFCIMGLSGSGKSTVVRHLNRLIHPTSGKITILGRDLLAMGERELRQMRSQEMGMVFQSMALFPHLTARENISFPLQIRGESKLRCWEVSQECLELVGLVNHGERMPEALSGGMKQRVGLARALASDPEILLMDEPFSALDPLIRRQLQDEFMALSEKLQKTTIFITHDLDEAIRIGHRIAMMRGGRVVQIGTPQEILSHPADDYVREFVEGVSSGEAS